MKTDKRSLASQLGSFFRPSHYAIIFRKHESDILSVSRNLFYSAFGQTENKNRFL